jgi:aldose 1-epimerase
VSGDDFLALEAGASRARLWPAVGGGLVDWLHDGVSLLRPTTGEALAAHNSQRLGSYPLVPYSNRIANARFLFGGQRFQLAHNYGEHPHSIHGIGWQRAWRVAEAVASRSRLVLDHDPEQDGAGAWPFRFRTEQAVTCNGHGLDIAMRIENCDSRPMPAGLGHHPYFPRTPGVSLQFEAQGVWLNGPDDLPSERIAVPPEWDYGRPRPLGEPGLDNCFTGWSGRARITWPERKLALVIEADPLYSHLVVFTPAGRDFFAVEPVSHMNDGINRTQDVADTGVRVLAPGAALDGEIRMRVERV